MDYVRRLGVEPSSDGVYTFAYDEDDEVHDQLVGDLVSEFGVRMPKSGDVVKITTDKSGVTGITVNPSGGRRRRRSRFHKKTRRSKRYRGYTKRR